MGIAELPARKLVPVIFSRHGDIAEVLWCSSVVVAPTEAGCSAQLPESVWQIRDMVAYQVIPVIMDGKNMAAHGRLSPSEFRVVLY